MTIDADEWRRHIREMTERDTRLRFWRTADQAIKAWQTTFRELWEDYKSDRPRPDIPTLLYSPEYGWAILDGNVAVSKDGKQWCNFHLLPGETWFVYERGLIDKRDPDFNDDFYY